MCKVPGAPSEEKDQEKRRDLFYEELLAGGPGDLADLVGVLVQAQRYDLLQGEVGAGVVEGALQVLTDLPPVPETSKTPVHMPVFTVHFVRQCFVTTVLINGDLRLRSHDFRHSFLGRRFQSAPLSHGRVPQVADDGDDLPQLDDLLPGKI